MDAMDIARRRDRLARDVRLRLLGGTMAPKDTHQFEKDLAALMARYTEKGGA